MHVSAFALNIAYGDIVKVEFDDGEFHFDELTEESGKSGLPMLQPQLKNYLKQKGPKPLN